VKLSEAISIYVEHKHRAGISFQKGKRRLLSFCKYVGDPALSQITAQDVLTFLDRPNTSLLARPSKHGLFRHFVEFWVSRQEMPPILLPKPYAGARSTFVPYIYTKEEIHRLLIFAGKNQRCAKCAIDGQTLRTILLTLYATGAIVSEVLNLSYEDVNLKSSVITIRSNRFGRYRRLPIAHDLRNVLLKYWDWRSRRTRNWTSFFVTKEGSPISQDHLTKRFKKLREATGIFRKDDAVYQPRVHDLKSTFAVHRITEWIKKGIDLNRLLPALSAYMGQVGLASTERYLSLTPERFRKELDRLSPGKAKRHWRDDRELMKFLETL
jgi:integrase/recombinase XerD